MRIMVGSSFRYDDRVMIARFSVSYKGFGVSGRFFELNGQKNKTVNMQARTLDAGGFARYNRMDKKAMYRTIWRERNVLFC